MFEVFAKFRDMPFDLLDKIMQSNLLNIPSKMIEVF